MTGDAGVGGAVGITTPLCHSLLTKNRLVYEESNVAEGVEVTVLPALPMAMDQVASALYGMANSVAPVKPSTATVVVAN